MVIETVTTHRYLKYALICILMIEIWSDKHVFSLKKGILKLRVKFFGFSWKLANRKIFTKSEILESKENCFLKENVESFNLFHRKFVGKKP